MFWKFDIALTVNYYTEWLCEFFAHACSEAIYLIHTSCPPTFFLMNIGQHEVVARRHLTGSMRTSLPYCLKIPLCKAGYRQFILWRSNYFGANNRNVAPSCVV